MVTCEGKVASAHLLCSADGPGAHAHSESISASLYEPLCLGTSDHIATDDLEVWVRRLEVLDHLYLKDRVTCTQRLVGAWQHSALAWVSKRI